jgi:hypothetical protein
MSGTMSFSTLSNVEESTPACALKLRSDLSHIFVHIIFFHRLHHNPHRALRPDRSRRRRSRRVDGCAPSTRTMIKSSRARYAVCRPEQRLKTSLKQLDRGGDFTE